MYKICAFVLIYFVLGIANTIKAGNFAGQEIETDGGYYMRARYYDPAVGAFLNKDPMGVQGGLNAYVYVGSNPVNGTDPLGLFGWYDYTIQSVGLVGGAIGAGVGYVATGVGGATVEVCGIGVPVAAAGYYLAAQGGAQAASSSWNLWYMIKHPNEKSVPLNSSGIAGTIVSTAAAVSGVQNSSSYSPVNSSGNWTIWGPLNAGATAVDTISTLVLGAALPTASNLGALTTIPGASYLPAPYAQTALALAPEGAPLAKTGTALDFAGKATNLTGALDIAKQGLYDTFQTENDTSQLAVGGVLINQAATLVGTNLSDIKGSTYDPTTKQIIFLGSNNAPSSSLTAINMDYFYTAIQAVYGSATPPYVTLDPPASAATQWPFSQTFTNNSTQGFVLLYNPLWVGQDTTIAVQFRVTDQAGTQYEFTANFNCVELNGTNGYPSVSSGGRYAMGLVYKNSTGTAPSGIVIDTGAFQTGVPQSMTLTSTSQTSCFTGAAYSGTSGNVCLT
jgi:RHS repeat-associated protein